ncbi:MAG: hypothetical protein P4L80_11380 [Xanthobacteraceae bacterium]|nr:hypothetical protein [Xanthobacteraceae bacterium]
MPKQTEKRTDLQLVTIVLIGAALSMHAGFAQDAGSTARDDAKASDHSAVPAAESPTKLDTPSPRGDNDKSVAGESGIDTRISAQPPRVGTKLGRDAKAKSELPALANVHRRTFPAARPSGQTVRDAIGVPVSRHGSAERHSGPHGPRIATPGTTASPSANSTKPEERIERPAIIAKPLVAPSVANRGAINGTGLVHRGTGPSRIGGPSAAVVGINGTTIRSKH